MVAKHKKFDMHGKAVNMELQPTRTINSILTSTPLGKAFACVTTDESTRVGKLFDAAYMHVGQGGNALHTKGKKIAMQLNRRELLINLDFA